MFPFSQKNTNLNFFFAFKGYYIESILMLLRRLQFDICYVIKTRLGFKIEAVRRFLN